MKIKDTPKLDRPREKLVKYGVKKLTDAELLAILLRTGTRNCNVINLSKKVLRGLKGNLDDISIERLNKIKGIGKVKSYQIIAIIELAKRINQSELKPVLINPEEVFKSVKEIGDSKKEHLLAIYLDVKNKEISREIISIGTLTASLVHPREIFEPAVRKLVAGIIIVHNHPSGDTEPSDEDIRATKQLVEAGKIMGIPIIDHLIVTKSSFYSFDEHDRLQCSPYF